MNTAHVLPPEDLKVALRIVNDTLGKKNRIIEQKNNIHVEPNFDLRKGRMVQAEVAKKHGSWALLINSVGTICYAIDPSGLRIGPFTSPHYLKAVVEEHIINYFLNELRDKLPKI